MKELFGIDLDPEQGITTQQSQSGTEQNENPEETAFKPRTKKIIDGCHYPVIDAQKPINT